MEVPDSSNAAAAALAKVQAVLADPEQRKSFVEGPEDTMRKADVPMDDIPSPVLDALKALSRDELELLGRLQTTLIDNGLYIKLPDGGLVCFL